jgi:hypothetical protein
VAKLTSYQVNLQLPWLGGVTGTWEPDRSEQSAAWEMYVELVTRVSVVNLVPEQGTLREALSSLYTLFDTTRNILRAHGPSVAQAKGEGDLSFGYLAVAILNGVLRPVLTKWHPLLADYENTRVESTSSVEHERRWSKNNELRQELDEVQGALAEYANLLARVADVPSLVAAEH